MTESVAKAVARVAAYPLSVAYVVAAEDVDVVVLSTISTTNSNPEDVDSVKNLLEAVEAPTILICE